MVPILLAGVAAGVTCGLAGLNIWAVTSVTIFFLGVTVIEGSVTGLGPGTIVLMFFIGATFLQLFYLIGSLFSQQRTLPASAPRPSRAELDRLVQAAIGQEMRMSFALPVDLPLQLNLRVAQLRARYG